MNGYNLNIIIIHQKKLENEFPLWQMEQALQGKNLDI